MVRTIFLSMLVILMVNIINFADDGRQVILLNESWKYLQGNDMNAASRDYDDSDWMPVNIPHDWAISGPFDPMGEAETGKLPWKGEVWYRKNFHLNPEDDGRRIYFLFDGIMAFPKIFINGKFALEWDYGYNSFYLDATELVKFGAVNTIAIHVDTREHESRWYPGAGIYRKIQMIITDPVHIGIWGTYVTTPTIKDNWTDVRIVTSIVNKSGKGETVTVQTTIVNPDGNEISAKSDEIKINPGSGYDLEQWTTLIKPRRWDVNNPVMYKVRSDIKVNGRISDTYYTNFGIREFKFTANDGFYLNNSKLQLKGVNLHHDLGPLGAAFNKRAMQRQLEIMKDMGCNAVRTSHNIPAPELLELCDEMGLLVIDEAYDKWDKRGDFIPGKKFFESAERNMTNFIKRDRNHPSIILWSIGNEMHDIQANEPGSFQKLSEMIGYFRLLDPSRPVTMVNDNMESVQWRHFDLIDVHSWNYGRRYLPARNADPSKPVIITESASTVSTRGFYSFPLPKEKTEMLNEDLQVSSYDMNAPWWAEPADLDFMWQEEDKYVCGEFVWTGFDYIGEPTPYNSSLVASGDITKQQAAVSSYFGIVDLCGIPKDRFYLYKSYWAPEKNTVHILPHWNWEGREGLQTPVFVYTNGDEAELFLNGKSLGIQKKNPKSKNYYERYRLMWNDVKYEPGELKTIAYKEGNVIGEAIVKTASEPFELRLTPDKNSLNADGNDLSFILVEAIDKEGNVCPLADNIVKFSINGQASIAAVGNGNPQSIQPFNADNIKLFYGKCMLIVHSKNSADNNIIVTALTEGLKETRIILTSE